MSKPSKKTLQIQDNYRRFLFDPVSRAVELLRNLTEDQRAEPPADVVLLPLADLSTTLYASPRDVVGKGFRPSRHTRLIAMVSSDPSGVLQDKWSLDFLRQLGSRRSVAAVATDLPFHGAGPRDPIYRKAREGLAWRLSYYGFLKQFGFPLVAVAKGEECHLLARLDAEHPRLFSGMIWISPLRKSHPKTSTPLLVLSDPKSGSQLTDFLRRVQRRQNA